MTYGVSIFIIAVGAILAFAVSQQVKGVDLQTVGVILMVVGGIGLVLSLIFWSSWSPRRRAVVVERRDDVDLMP